MDSEAEASGTQHFHAQALSTDARLVGPKFLYDSKRLTQLRETPRVGRPNEGISQRGPEGGFWLVLERRSVVETFPLPEDKRHGLRNFCARCVDTVLFNKAHPFLRKHPIRQLVPIYLPPPDCCAFDGTRERQVDALDLSLVKQKRRLLSESGFASTTSVEMYSIKLTSSVPQHPFLTLLDSWTSSNSP